MRKILLGEIKNRRAARFGRAVDVIQPAAGQQLAQLLFVLLRQGSGAKLHIIQLLLIIRQLIAGQAANQRIGSRRQSQ